MFTGTLAATLIRRPAVLQSEAPPLREPRPSSLPRRMAGRVSWPLVAILALQAGFSLSLVWSNTAFTDEAYYLWQGHLEWARWLHGYPIPAFHDSGAPEIYPALGALADSVGGLAGARILSLCFMLGATVLLYLTASRLFGRRAAIVGSALWALSEPVLRLAFATYDPMACFLVTLAAWLALQAGLRRRRLAWVAASAITLALACATAFSFAIMVPVVVAFAFFVWADIMSARRAFWYAACLLAGTIALPAVVATVFHLWKDAFGSTVARQRGLGYGATAVARSAWSWDGLMLALACIGLVAAVVYERHWSRKLLMLTFVGAGLLVPAYQTYIGTGYSLDKHMSAGTWFLAMAAGYGVARITANVRWKPVTAASIAAALLAFPAITGLWYARATYHAWPNTSALVTSLEPLLRETTRPIVVGGDVGVIIMHATPQGYDWSRWRAGGSSADFRFGRMGVVVLQLNSTLNSPQLPRQAVTGDARNLSAEILRLSTNGINSTTTEFATVEHVEQSTHYRLQYVIPFTTTNQAASNGVFAVWKRVG